MKSYFYKVLLLAGMGVSSAGAFSLYDMAPTVGLPQSHAIKYNAYVRMGYDSNMDASFTDSKASAYVSGGVGASYADFESVDKISYSFNLGATHYLKNSQSGEKTFADCGLSATLVHAFTARSTYSATLSVTYSPEPDYANGISAARRQGDCLYWSFSNTYSQAIDARWSWNVNASYSGNLYSETDYSYDDRQYISTGAGLSYRASELLSYNVNLSYRYDFRDYGNNSDNVIATVGFSRALDPVSSCSGSIGGQIKMSGGTTFVSPNISLGYNRTVSEGFSTRAYLTLSNENVDTYRGGSDYLSDLALRVGVDCTYTLSPDVSFVFGVSVLRSEYSRGTNGMADEKNTTLNPTIGMNYRFSENLSGNIRYSYTFYESDRAAGTDDYDRHNLSAGLTYSF